MFQYTLSFVACATLVASLEADTLQLNPIVVSASKIEQSLNNVTANINIITAQELEEKHITSVIDALRIPGNIAIAQSGGIGQQSSFFQRGFSSENTVIMIDGIRYNDPTTTKGQGQLEHLMVNDIERIEIIHGAQSGVWGANAVAGVINIITKKATDKLRMNGNLEYGSYATTKAGANISQKLGAFSYYLGVNQIRTDGISAITPPHHNPDEYESDGYRNQTVNVKLGYDLSAQDTLRAQMTLIDAKIDYDAYAQPDSTANEIHQINRLGNIGYRHAFNAEDYIDATYALTTFDKKDPLGYTTEFKGENREFNLIGTFHYNADGSVVIGANTLRSKDTIGIHKLNSQGLFATNTNSIGSFVVTESIRRDTYDSFKDKTTGKIGAKYFLNDDIVLSSNYGTAYRVPSLYELYAGYYGNPNLQPETTKSLDATVQYKHLSLTYYNNRVTNLIGYNPSTYVNEQVEGTSHLKGYEVRYSHTLSEAVAFDLAYNRLFAKDKDGNTLARRPQETVTGSLSYYPTEKLSLNANANYIGTRYDNTAKTVQTGRYTLFGAVVNYAVNDSLALYLRGENLGDKRYQEVSGYGTPGRSVYVGLTTKF
ncbi:TonB-dependent receptor [Sulfuricurvum sp.]|uniref:TonB-dependent receptor domain-containing protein n=1 Tax=Sulfuricurvum sp. TaxID=2025608 RepID=UPI0026262CD0|nr:TonB-dependent receptor [Sulfuricurvum sp.]MDD3595380.1 TonB-dependent receptor [Sulfuricurvum sp.]